MVLSGYETEREAWEHIHGPEGAALRREFDAEFNMLFPRGHEGSLRGLVEHFGRLVAEGNLETKPRLEYLHQVHPQAFEVIATYGVDYTPKVFTKPAPEPEAGKCFENAWASMMAWHGLKEKGREICEGPAFYVEGIVVGSQTLPMLHAWNAFGNESTVADDWTFYTVCQWNRYFGVLLNREEYWEIFGNQVTSLFAAKTFPHTKERLLRILTRRSAERAA